MGRTDIRITGIPTGMGAAAIENRGLAVPEAEFSELVAILANSGGGTRTPDTRIMIPLL
jgi:hypothetical protein